MLTTRFMSGLYGEGPVAGCAMGRGLVSPVLPGTLLPLPGLPGVLCPSPPMYPAMTLLVAGSTATQPALAQACTWPL